MKIVIIGNGIAGTNAARHIRKLNSEAEITMISEETLQPYSRTALMYVYMGHQRQRDTWLYEDWFWEKNRIGRLLGKVTHVDTTHQQVQIHTPDGAQHVLNYTHLIIASGSKPNFFNWPGQDLKGVQGMYHLQDLERLEALTPTIKHAVVVGGGLIGIELVEMLLARKIPVTFLVREQSFWDFVLPPQESQMINRHIREHGIDLRLSTELLEIRDDGTGRVGSVVTKSGEVIDCQFVGITVGVSPNIDFVKGGAVETNRGILVNERLETSVPHVYAIGDCAELRQPQQGRRPIEAIWYTGRMMGQTVAHTITGVPTNYVPRLWFNSAKFFDIEYQIYGDVPALLPDHAETLYWEHPSGKKAIRINYAKSSGAVLGFHLMGVRYRHEVCERWIQTQTPIDKVLAQLSLANFDPEFFDQYEPQIRAQYAQKTGNQIPQKEHRSLSAVRKFLKIN